MSSQNPLPAIKLVFPCQEAPPFTAGRMSLRLSRERPRLGCLNSHSLTGKAREYVSSVFAAGCHRSCFVSISTLLSGAISGSRPYSSYRPPLSPRFWFVRWRSPSMWRSERWFWMLFSVVSGPTACESATRSYRVLIIFERAGVAPRSSRDAGVLSSWACWVWSRIRLRNRPRWTRSWASTVCESSTPSSPHFFATSPPTLRKEKQESWRGIHTMSSAFLVGAVRQIPHPTVSSAFDENSG